jgi:hypothetical protein
MCILVITFMCIFAFIIYIEGSVNPQLVLDAIILGIALVQML